MKERSQEWSKSRQARWKDNDGQAHVATFTFPDNTQ